MGPKGNVYKQTGSRSQQYNAHTQNFYYDRSKNERAAPKPFSTVPFLRDPNFVERSEYLQLAKKLSSGKARVALTGFGGAGKSQLAIECCYRTRERSSDCWVFWIHASSSERLQTGLKDLADRLQLPERLDAGVDILQIVERWLHGSGSQWLLILDNADFEDVLFKPANTNNAASPNTSNKRTIDYLATPSCGQTILTTRHRKVASKFVDECDIITVGPMTKSDAITLLHNKIGEHHRTENVDDLISELGCVPLAIAQAAAFIIHDLSPCPVQTYLNKLRETINSDASLLKANYNELRRDPQADNSAISTWQVSFEHIRQIKPSAADCLSLMSFYDHRGIPRSLLRVTDSAGPLPIDPERAGITTPTETDLDSDILMLYEFHLVSIGVEREDIVLHPLQQLAVRSWLTMRGKESQWMCQSLRNLSYALPDETDVQSPQWAVLYANCYLVLTYQPRDKASGLLLADICITFATSRDTEASKVFLRRCLDERRHHLGNDHHSTLWAELRLSEMLKRSTREEEKQEAQVMFTQCLTVAEKSLNLGREWRGLLASCLLETGRREAWQGHLADAETHCRKALELCDGVAEHAIIPECVDRLRDVLLSRQKNSEAENICRQAHETCLRFGKGDHPSTVRVTASLAGVLQANANWLEALEMWKRVLQAYQRMHGDDHIVTINVMRKVSVLLPKVNRAQEGAELAGRAHRLCIDRFGEDSIIALHRAKFYAIALWEAGQSAQGLQVMRECAAISRQRFGPIGGITSESTSLVTKWERELGNQSAPIVSDEPRRGGEEQKCVIQ